MQLHSEILRLCKIADQYLWSTYHGNKDRVNSLIFPESHSKLRVSEQEARFAFVEALCRESSFKYSAETPTTKNYSFTGQDEVAAQTDLTVYNADGSRVCNVEFKAGGFSLKRKNLLPVSKDVQKLLREPEPGLWFHLLESTNSATVSNLLDVLKNCISQTKMDIHDIDLPEITVHICVLKQKIIHQFQL